MRSHSSAKVGRPSGCQVIDVTVHSPAPHRIDFISFQNYYTYCITIRCSRKDSQTGGHHQVSPWQPCIKDLQLMPNCHCEQGGQNWVVLRGADSMTALEDVSHLRLILRQPSPHWREFGVREIKCFTRGKDSAKGGSPAQTGQEGYAPQGRDQLECISDRMQGLLGQGPRALDSGRAGGQQELPYEVNLLSYT